MLSSDKNVHVQRTPSESAIPTGRDKLQEKLNRNCIVGYIKYICENFKKLTAHSSQQEA